MDLEIGDDDSDALREKETGIDDETVEKFDRGASADFEQVRSLSLSVTIIF